MGVLSTGTPSRKVGGALAPPLPPPMLYYAHHTKGKTFKDGWSF